jgi:hypothetical protein
MSGSRGVFSGQLPQLWQCVLQDFALRLGQVALLDAVERFVEGNLPAQAEFVNATT